MIAMPILSSLSPRYCIYSIFIRLYQDIINMDHDIHVAAIAATPHQVDAHNMCYCLISHQGRIIHVVLVLD